MTGLYNIFMNSPEAIFRVAANAGPKKNFYSRSPESGICAPTIICHVARKRVIEGADFSLPEGQDDTSLLIIGWRAAKSDREVYVPNERATDLRDIGRQILRLNDEDMIQPPLVDVEIAHINQLIDVVGAAEKVS